MRRDKERREAVAAASESKRVKDEGKASSATPATVSKHQDNQIITIYKMLFNKVYSVL